MRLRSSTRPVLTISLMMMLFGFFSKSFILIRPNRIEKGEVVNLYSSMGSDLSVLVFALLIGLIISLLLRKWKYNFVLITVILSILLGSYIGLTGIAASRSLIGYGEYARASLGAGFWAILLSMLLMLYEICMIQFEWLKENQSKYKNLVKPLFTLLVIVIMVSVFSLGYLDDVSIVREVINNRERLSGEIVNHLLLVLVTTTTGFIVSIALGYLAYKKERVRDIISTVINFAQVIPTLSLFGIVIILITLITNEFTLLKQVGIRPIGFLPAYLVLTLYTLLPLTNNTIAGFKSIPNGVLEAARAMGMNKRQLFFDIELPMALPSIFIGLKTAMIQSMGNGILAGLVGGGGLGAVLFLGLAQSATDLVVAASLTIVILTILLNVLLNTIDDLLIVRFRGGFND